MKNMDWLKRWALQSLGQMSSIALCSQTLQHGFGRLSETNGMGVNTTSCTFNALSNAELRFVHCKVLSCVPILCSACPCLVKTRFEFEWALEQIVRTMRNRSAQPIRSH
jgi:hypothetical protein